MRKFLFASFTILFLICSCGMIWVGYGFIASDTPTPTPITVGFFIEGTPNNLPTSTPNPIHTSTVTPFPTFAPSPSPMVDVLPTVTPFPATERVVSQPNNTPTPSLLEQQTNQDHTWRLLSASIELGKAISEIDKLIVQPKFDDSAWLTQTTRQIAFLRQHSETLIALTNSGTNPEINQLIRVAASYCQDAGRELDNAVLQSDRSALQTTVRQTLEQCGEDVAYGVNEAVTTVNGSLLATLPTTTADNKENNCEVNNPVNCIQIITPSKGDIVRGVVGVTGQLNFEAGTTILNYRFEHGPSPDGPWHGLYTPPPDEISTISLNEPVLLMEWYTTAIPPGVYWIRLVVEAEKDGVWHNPTAMVQVVVANMQRLPTATPQGFTYETICTKRDRATSADDWEEIVTTEYRNRSLNTHWKGTVAQHYKHALIEEYELWLHINHTSLDQLTTVPPDVKFALNDINVSNPANRELYIGQFIEFTGYIQDVTSLPAPCTVTLENVTIQ